MSTITFDALRYTDELIEVGVPEKQAKQQVRILQNAMNEVAQGKDLTTKSDLKDLEIRLVKWAIGMHAITIGLVVTLVKLL